MYNGQQYNHLPAALAQQLAAIAPLSAPRGCGCGCGHGHGRGNAAAPPPVMVCIFYSLCPLSKNLTIYSIPIYLLTFRLPIKLWLNPLWLHLLFLCHLHLSWYVISIPVLK